MNTNTKPTISVIIPVYNAEHTVKRCVDSVVSQTYQNIEIIAVDDNSTDASFDICTTLSDTYPNITLLSSGNKKGVSAARNTGILAAGGDYIFFLDADDYIRPKTLEILLNAALKDKSDITFCDYLIKTSKGESRSSAYGSYRLFLKEPAGRAALSTEIPTRDCLIPERRLCFVHNKLIKRDFLGDTLFDESLSACEDTEFIFRLMTKAAAISYVPFSGYVYTINSSSATRSFRADYPDRFIRALKKIRAFINSDPALYKYLEAYYSCVLYHLLLISVNYSFNPERHDSCSAQIKEFKKICSYPIFKEALRHIHLKDFSLSRRIPLIMISKGFYLGVKKIADIRHKQR